MPDNWNRAWNQPYTQPVGGVSRSTINTIAPSTTGTTPGLAPVIQGLLTPGLVPDIARQSAEISAGRGIPGSPAGASTSVRMSEQNYLQRLALANALLTGEAGRSLPYQITPYQSAALQNQLDVARLNQRPPSLPGGGGGGGSRGTSPTYPFAGFSGFSNGLAGGGGPLGMDSGPAGLGRTPYTLDDMYD